MMANTVHRHDRLVELIRFSADANSEKGQKINQSPQDATAKAIQIQDFAQRVPVVRPWAET